MAPVLGDIRFQTRTRHAAGADVAAQLGHASIQTTLDRYGHLMPEMHEAEARKLDWLVFGDRGHDGGRSLEADALQRSQFGHTHEEGVSGDDR